MHLDTAFASFVRIRLLISEIMNRMKFGEIMDEVVSDVMSVLPGSVFQYVEIASEPYFMPQGSVPVGNCVRVRPTKSISAKIIRQGFGGDSQDISI